jgi:hypothetical protein
MLIASVENSEHVEPKVKALVYDLVVGDTLTERLTATIPRAASRFIANLFYGVQVVLTLFMFVWACQYQLPRTAFTADPAPTIIAESSDLRGRAP